jgi:hypothetical protein
VDLNTAFRFKRENNGEISVTAVSSAASPWNRRYGAL